MMETNERINLTDDLKAKHRLLDLQCSALVDDLWKTLLAARTSAGSTKPQAEISTDKVAEAKRMMMAMRLIGKPRDYPLTARSATSLISEMALCKQTIRERLESLFLMPNSQN
jgi:hypothetical protein